MLNLLKGGLLVRKIFDLNINYKLSQTTLLFLIIIIFNFIMAYYMYINFDDSDFSGLPKKDSTKLFDNRYIALFYFNSTTISTIGAGEIIPISNRARLFIGIYAALVTAGIFTAFEILL
jgi:hypothetical protein